MNQYIETIRIEEGHLHLLPLHQSRMEATIRELYGANAPLPSLEKAIPATIEIPASGLYKCRVVYDRDIRKIEIEPYAPRPVHSLRIVEAPPELDYHLKSADRSQLAAMAARKGDCDEVIIVRRGLITDTSYTNLIFKSASGLLTPSTPLLAGTMRRHLLDLGLATEAELTPADLLPGNRLGITHAIMVNAMMPIEKAPMIEIAAISKKTGKNPCKPSLKR